MIDLFLTAGTTAVATAANKSQPLAEYSVVLPEGTGDAVFPCDPVEGGAGAGTCDSLAVSAEPYYAPG